MASSRRQHRRGIADHQAAEDYDDDGGSSGTLLAEDTDTGGTTDDEEEEDPRLNLGLHHSMTAKGIQHLCSELLEINKASEQDLRANVYLSYLSFIRMFHEAGDLDKDVQRLKRQVIAHSRLIQHLSSSCGGLLSSAASLPSTTHSDEDADTDTDMDDEEVELEALLSEHRMEQALELVLQQKKQQGSWVVVADRLASVAGNPRTPRPELLKALSGLCKLGEAERANRLLFSWHRGRLVLFEARMVFSSIAGASRSLAALHGERHPYTPQLLRWAREEMVEGHFSGYVLSPCQQVHNKLALALEAAECAAASSLQLQVDVAGLMAPCILQQALPMYARHLKEVLRLLVASDADQALGRFRVLQPAADDYSYCLLTASGRKFVTLLQEVVHDVACPLQRLGMDSAAVQLVADDLFGEYMRQLTMIPNPDSMWQVSVLINCTTLVSLLPAIARGAWSEPAQARVGSLIKEAAGQVVFLRVRRLKEAYGDDDTMRELLRQLMEAIISCLSTNPPESWTTTAHQAHLDVHFLLEIARLGGFDVTASALGLLAETEIDGHCAAWAANHAVQVLLRHNIGSASPHEERASAAAVGDAADEFESESSNDMATSSKSSDEFISIQDDDGEEKLIILGSDRRRPGQEKEAAGPDGSELMQGRAGQQRMEHNTTVSTTE